MDFFKNKIINFWKEIVIGTEAIGLILLVVLLQNKSLCATEAFQEVITPVTDEVAVTQEAKTIKVDIKGAVVNPGVYEVLDTNNVDDVITLAGGLKKTADTSNLNLSRRISDQMVIKVFTSSEIKKLNTATIDTASTCTSNTIVIDSCKDSSIVEVNETTTNTVSSTTEQNQSQTATETTTETITNDAQNESKDPISINTATLEQLMSLNGIGESKAKSIIEYRQTVGKFTKIEDIMNVSGIGEAVFNKIKDYITI